MDNVDYKTSLALFNEQVEVHDMMKDFNSNYCKCKKQIDEDDLNVLTNELGAWTMELQYEILHKALAEEDPDFDQEKMGNAIKNLMNQVNESNQDFTKYKGEFLRVNEPCVNRD